MGVLAKALAQLGGLLPERKVAMGAQVSTWEAGNPQSPRYYHNFYRYALEGYSSSEIVYACIEELATSAAEPRLVPVRKDAKGKPEQLHDHPILELFERPNPFTSRFQLIATHIMFRAVAGNAYLSLARSAAGKTVEIWPLRPDRVRVIPDRQRYIGGWEYTLDGETPVTIKPADLIQSKTRNPLDEWYGLPPLAVCAPRVDTDAMLRAFTLAFFRNAGVPAGLLTVTKQVTAAERQIIRDKYRGETGGPQNWHQLLVMDNTAATYTPMGMPLGASGIVLPELDEICEARIAMAFGVPLELVGARLGMIHGNRTTTAEARATFWDETLVPLYQELAADLTRGLAPEYADTPDSFDYLEFDLSTVKALQEDEDKKHTRVRADAAAGIVSVQEARAALGYEPQYEKDAFLILARGLEPMLATDAETGGPPQQEMQQGTLPGAAGQNPPTTGNGNGNGHRNGNGSGKGTLSAADLAALTELAAGKG